MASRRSWAKAGYPFCGLVPRRAGKGAVLPEARSFDDKFDAVGAPSAERGRSAQTCRTSAESAPKKAPKRQQKKKPLSLQKEASALSLQRAHGQRPDCASGVLAHACRSDELHRNGTCRACRSAG